MNSQAFNKKNFFDRINYAQHKIICICIDVYIKYQDNDFNKNFEDISELKNKNKKIRKLIENYNEMDENFQQDYYSRTAKLIYRFGHKRIMLFKWLAYYDSFI